MSGLWEEWFKRESEKLKSKGSLQPAKRRYIHFDIRPTELDPILTRVMLEPENVARRSFYPFLRFDKSEEHFRKVKGKRGRQRTIKHRPIDYAAHKDALVYSWYGFLLSKQYEQEIGQRGIGEHIIAYRSLKTEEGRGKTNIHFAKDAFDFIRGHAPCFVILLDIRKFYEELDHAYLKEKWAQLLGISWLPEDHFRIFESITKYHFVRKGRIMNHWIKARRAKAQRIFTPAEFQKFIIKPHLQETNRDSRGIPQGSPMSCVLANLYMIDFDTVVSAAIKEIGGFYRRYSDDILIVCPFECAARMEKFIKDRTEQELGLKIKEEKTERRHCVESEGVIKSIDPLTGAATSFQYLGIESDGATPRVRHSSLARFQRRLLWSTETAIGLAYKKGCAGAPKRFLYDKFLLSGKSFLGYSKRVSKVFNASSISQQVSTTRTARRLKEKIEKLVKARWDRKKDK